MSLPNPLSNLSRLLSFLPLSLSRLLSRLRLRLRSRLLLLLSLSLERDLVLPMFLSDLRFVASANPSAHLKNPQLSESVVLGEVLRRKNSQQHALLYLERPPIYIPSKSTDINLEFSTGHELRLSLSRCPIHSFLSSDCK